jgi:hypothetical protein
MRKLRRHVAGELLDPFVRWIAVRVEVDVRQPLAPHPAAHERFRQQTGSGAAADVLPERAVATGVQHVIRGQLGEVERHLRAVGILDRDGG